MLGILQAPIPILVLFGALVICVWCVLRLRSKRRELEHSTRLLRIQLEQQQRSLEASVSQSDLLTDALGTVMMIATNCSGTIASDQERREALLFIARSCREAVREQREQKEHEQ